MVTDYKLDSETEVYGANIKYGANKAEPLIGRLGPTVRASQGEKLSSLRHNAVAYK
jgi:hypothetical protein